MIPSHAREASSGPIRVGLIGAGKMGVHHLRAINRVAGATVVGIADPATTSRDAFEGLLPADARIVATADELINDIHPDVVHIVTPPGTHASLAIRALRAGCHVYVEKPFTPTRAEAAEVLATAVERGLQVCAGHQYLCERPAILARERLSQIGRLVHVESYFSFRMVRRTIAPADQAQDILPHAVYPLVEQLRLGSGLADAPFEIVGVDVRAEGDVYALVRLGDCTGVLLVTLSGRPIEQYQQLVGTNGSMRADYVIGGVVTLLGPGTGPGILFTPYRRAWQTLTKATTGFTRLVTRKTSYPGLETLIERFYTSLRTGAPSPITPRSILDTVDICQRIGEKLDQAEQRFEAAARERVAAREAALPPVRGTSRAVLVTGGTGLLGRRVAEELRSAGLRVRVIARREPRWSVRAPGVEYVPCDLSRPVDPAVLEGVTTVVHCAAETAGTKDEHERNSIAATRHILEATAAAGITSFVHVSSLAVLKPGSSPGREFNETSPVDTGNLERGPYVWGKAESEVVAQRRGAELGVSVRVVRPGPLVDYSAFQPPGRLGRELGPWFVAIGGKEMPLSVCDVGTAARVLRSYVQDFDAAPLMLNLVEAPPPTRAGLAQRLASGRPDLRIVWLPALLLKLLSSPLKLAQRIVLGSAKPVDIYSAFASEHYRTDLARTAIEKAGPTAIGAETRQMTHV